MNRTLDYRIGGPLDRRNLAHRIGTTNQPTEAVWWQGGPVLDQGPDGSCVGHGVVGEYLASPVRGRLYDYEAPGTDTPPVITGPRRAEIGHQLAVHVYERAKSEFDEWQGSDYEGTSVLAGMKVMRERGWCDAYSWALSIAELRAAVALGPVVIGVEWHEDDFEPPGGIVWGEGPVAGGHCVLVTGWTPYMEWVAGPAFRVRNSWGRWGYRSSGNCWVPEAAMDRILFQAGGEAAIPTGRHL